MQRKTCQIDCKIDHIHRRNDIYKWHITGERACIFLRNIKKFLVIKEERAELVLGKYIKHLSKMERPARRNFHIRKERILMKKLGWD